MGWFCAVCGCRWTIIIIASGRTARAQHCRRLSDASYQAAGAALDATAAAAAAAFSASAAAASSNWDVQSSLSSAFLRLVSPSVDCNHVRLLGSQDEDVLPARRLRQRRSDHAEGLWGHGRALRQARKARRRKGKRAEDETSPGKYILNGKISNLPLKR